MMALGVRKDVLLFLSLAILTLQSCGEDVASKGIQKPVVTKATQTTSTKEKKLFTFKQGWTEDNKQAFYFTSQGSQLIPCHWYLALEQADNSTSFNDAKNIKRLGYIPQHKQTPINKDGLPTCNQDEVPIGFAIDKISEESPSRIQGYQDWMGFTCAACHTSEIRFQGQTLRIDGGPPLSDMQTFLQAMLLALQATTNDDEKLSRFTGKLSQQYEQQSSQNKEIERVVLKKKIDTYIAWLSNYTEMNYAGLTTDYGYGRLDAFGAILNRVSVELIGIKENASPANAPVSYPFLWNTSKLTWVQWNGSVNNHIGRNVGEVTGVFAHTFIKTDETTKKYKGIYSSANVVNLFQLEELIGKLKSPKWQSPLPAIDMTRAGKGKELFKENCVRCHAIRDENGNFPMVVLNEEYPDKEFIQINMTALDEIDTDRLMAENFAGAKAATAAPGVLVALLPPELKRIRGEQLTVVGQQIIGTKLPALNQKLDKGQLDTLQGYVDTDEHPPNVMAYKARPLNGIWATAPYLHNGSVPSLYDLLLPSSLSSVTDDIELYRPNQFYIGGQEFDPVNVGFKPIQAGNNFLFKTVDDQGKSIPGNGNYGHEGKNYTQSVLQDGSLKNFTSDERLQLVEYMKTL
jgi:mono/diheme cytochrome c family protein